MNIYYFAPTFAPQETGFAIAFKNFCEVLIKHEEVDNIFVFAPVEEEYDHIEGIKVTYFNKDRLPNLLVKWLPFRVSKILMPFLFKKYLKGIKPGKDDIFFVESIFLAFASFSLTKIFPNNKIVTRVHGALPEVAHWTGDKWRNRLMKYFLKTDNVAVTTYHYIDYINSYFKPKQSNSLKYIVLPNTLPDIDVKDLNEKKDRLDEEPLKLLQLGRMDEYGYFQKGFQDVLQALVYIDNNEDSNIANQIHYSYIGNGEMKGGFDEKLSELKNIQVSSYTSLPNNKVQELISEAHVILMPSRYEGMSMFATECLEKGKAFIFTNDGGMRDMIFDKVNGIAVRTFDYLAIANGIMEFYNNPSMITNYERQSKVIFNNNFSYSAVLKHIDNLILL